jgi:hypothetical protein
MSDVTLDGFYSFMPHLEIDANNQMLLDEATNHGTVELVHYDQLRAAAARLGSKLAIRQEYADGWNQFVAKFPQYGGTYANRDVAFSLLNPYEEPTPAAFLEIAQRASRPLATNAEYQQAQEETRERAQMIQELTAYMLDENGKPKRDYVRIYPEKMDKYLRASIEELREYRPHRPRNFAQLLNQTQTHHAIASTSATRSCHSTRPRGAPSTFRRARAWKHPFLSRRVCLFVFLIQNSVVFSNISETLRLQNHLQFTQQPLPRHGDNHGLPI